MTFKASLSQSNAPVLLGLVLALLGANLAPQSYQSLVGTPIVDGEFLGHPVTFRFLMNDGVMVWFFGIAASELTDALRSGGALHPLSRAANPIVATLGGILMPAVIYLSLVHGLLRGVGSHDVLMRSWVIPTATDIAIAWSVGRLVFGGGHPALQFLLLLAIVDDVVGMLLIAALYPPAHVGMDVMSGLFCGAGLVTALLLKYLKVADWRFYVVGPGVLVWLGLLGAPIHASLALLPVVPLIPRSEGANGNRFQSSVRPWVQVGLLGFGLANGGVALGSIMSMAWIVLAALVIGKTVGVSVFSILAARLCGLPIPRGMSVSDVVVVGLLASMGLTVSLFIVAQALPEGSAYAASARLGALSSLLVGAGLVAWARLFRRSS